MAIDLTSEFSSKKIRVALYFSPHGITGQYYILNQDNQAPKPPHFGMDTIGYRAALVKQGDCPANQSWLKKDAEIDFEEGRYIYAENERGEAYPCEGSIIKRSYVETALGCGDRLVDRFGAIVASRDYHENPQMASPLMTIR